MGYELAAADYAGGTGSLTGGDIFVDLDPGAGVLTLMPQKVGSLGTYELWINNAVFNNPTEHFSSLSPLLGTLGDGAYLSTSFTDDSLHIYYSVIGSFTTELKPVTFSVGTIASPVPEPEQGALLLSGITALAPWLRKRIKK